MSHTDHLPDCKQSVWQLTAIQLSGWTSLPILATSILILEGNSFLGSVLTLILGNAILWFLRLGIISMSFDKRQSTLDISRDYLGKGGRYFIAVLLLLSTLAWFITQTTSGSHSITQLLPLNEDPNIDQFIQVSVFFGIVSTLFCMGGIVLLRRLSIFCFPILVLGFFAVLYLLPEKRLAENHLPLSLSGLTLVLATNLGFTADLPTFFRHSASWKTSVNALTLIQLFSLTLGLCSLYMGSIITGTFDINHQAIFASGNDLLRFAIIGFIFVSVVCANVANVYSASVGWEIIAPKALVGRKELFIMGLGLTTVFILIAGLFSLEFLLNFSDGSLVNLSVVLLLGYVISRQGRKLPNLFEQRTLLTAWALATMVNAMQLADLALSQYSTIGVSLVVILAVVGAALVGRRYIKIG